MCASVFWRGRGDELHQHLVWTQAAIAIQVDAAEPVLQAELVGLVLLAEDEPDKVLVAHLALHLAHEGPRCL